MPAVAVSKKPGAKGGEEPKKKKELPKELCGCGVDTYRAPPKGKKLPAPIEHAPGCGYQRTTCDAYPHLPKCVVCQDPCKFCGGKNRWCPHCYENQCKFQYKRLVHGFAKENPNVGPATAESLAENAGNAPAPRKSTTAKARSGTVTFAGGDS
ncbi:hypothetical protein ADEAN_000047900 [Angomonas deanei]|uniref:Uncharacterized protein n=1 Tax=Angomonas deanei TaxID=59799 RepID=A0A7G2C2V0_9TRYP|nr:hypothetical protein ADEAN_000047900 [Angomonas deanei]